MLFDLAPKRRKEDLYDFEGELKAVSDAFRRGRIIMLLAMRRMGKTSLLHTFINEYKVPAVFLDARSIALSGYVNFRSFAIGLGEALNDFMAKSRRAPRLIELLRNVRGVEVGVGVAKVALKWGRKERVDLASLMGRLDEFAGEGGVKVLVAIDEAQELRPIKRVVLNLLAFSYDNLRNVVFALTGSEVGLLYDLLSVHDPDSPLYGRYIHEVKLRRLTEEEALDFLRRGFEEVDVNVSESTLQKAVEALDGVIGWLTFFGWSYYSGNTDLENVMEAAAKQELKELERFLVKSSAEKRYKAILKAIAEKPLRWSAVKRLLEAEEGVEVDDKNFNELLQRLVKLGFVEETANGYGIADPILRYAVGKLLK